MTLARWLSLTLLLLPAVRCTSVKALPVCYYTAEFPGAAREASVVEVKDALTTLFAGRLTIADAHDSSLLIARGPSPVLARLIDIWPDVGCIGDPRTPADVVKRNACREDMKVRVGGPAAPQAPSREGTLYLCRR